MGRLSGYLAAREHPALAPARDLAPDTARLRVEHGTRLSRLRFDHRTRARRGDLLIAGDEGDHRSRMTAEALQRRDDEGVHDEPRLHVADAGPIGAPVLDAERPPLRLALGEYRVAMPHQDDGALVVALMMLEERADLLAEARLWNGIERQPFGREIALQHLAGRIDALFVIAAGIGVHELGQELDHGVVLLGEPAGQLPLILRLAVAHPRLPFLVRPSITSENRSPTFGRNDAISRPLAKIGATSHAFRASVR